MPRQIDDLFTTTTGQFGFQISASGGEKVVIQASQDLVRWEDLQATTVGSGSFIFKDDASGKLGCRFYRVVANDGGSLAAPSLWPRR